MPSYARKVLDLKTQALSCFLLLTFLTAPPLVLSASDETVTLENLVAEGLTNSPVVLAA